MSNIISINSKMKSKSENDKKESRKIIYDKAAEIERRCFKIKEYANSGRKDAFLWSNVAMLYQNLEVMNKQINILIDDVDSDGEVDETDTYDFLSDDFDKPDEEDW